MQGADVNYYEILNVSPDATQQEIKRAYFKVSQSVHPDKNASAQHFMVLVNRAYETLSKESTRAEYDLAMGDPSFAPPAPNTGPTNAGASSHSRDPVAPIRWRSPERDPLPELRVVEYEPIQVGGRVRMMAAVAGGLTIASVVAALSALPVSTMGLLILASVLVQLINLLAILVNSFLVDAADSGRLTQLMGRFYSNPRTAMRLPAIAAGMMLLASLISAIMSQFQSGSFGVAPFIPAALAMAVILPSKYAADALREHVIHDRLPTIWDPDWFSVGEMDHSRDSPTLTRVKGEILAHIHRDMSTLPGVRLIMSLPGHNSASPPRDAIDQRADADLALVCDSALVIVQVVEGHGGYYSYHSMRQIKVESAHGISSLPSNLPRMVDAWKRWVNFHAARGGLGIASVLGVVLVHTGGDPVVRDESDGLPIAISSVEEGYEQIYTMLREQTDDPSVLRIEDMSRLIKEN